jgi:hypothetical protein
MSCLWYPPSMCNLLAFMNGIGLAKCYEFWLMSFLCVNFIQLAYFVTTVAGPPMQPQSEHMVGVKVAVLPMTLLSCHFTVWLSCINFSVLNYVIMHESQIGANSLGCRCASKIHMHTCYIT